MYITDLIDGPFKHVASTSGGEYAGACPFCGGSDRFRVWPETDRAWCRQCGWKGDSIQIVRDTKGMSYPEACQYLRIEPKKSNGGTPAKQWQPKPSKPGPGNAWRQKSQSFLTWAQGRLQEDQSVLDWLTGARGLTADTIHTAGLGYNPRQFYHDREAWGIQPELSNKTGKPKRVWLPAGLVIPSFDGGRLVRLRIRRDQIGPKDDRYILVPGGSTRPMVLGAGSTVVIVESELDAILINQMAGDLVAVVALGNAQIRPDAETDKWLRQADLILNALDADEAGAKEAWGFWYDNYSAKRWPCIRAKDPTEMMQAGVNVREWIKAALPAAEPAAEPCLKIHPMTKCLDGKPCPHLDGPGGRRPICEKTDTPVFDLTICPLGRWAGNIGGCNGKSSMEKI